MKTSLLALFVVSMLPLMSFDCINDPHSITISLNLKPFNATYPLNNGSSKTYAGADTINPGTLYDQSYTLTGATVYDIQVSTKGPDLGLGSGVVYVGTGFGSEDTLFTYNGRWSLFNTPQSLLTSTLITKNAKGVKTLTDAVVNKSPQITLRVSGTISTPPPAQNLDFLIVSAYVQAYGHL